MIAAEGPGERAQAIRVGDREVGVARRGAAPDRRCRGVARRPEARTICPAPAGHRGSAHRMRRAQPDARAHRATPGPQARPGGRSYCRRGRTAPWPRPRLAGRRRPRAGPGQRCAAGECPWRAATDRAPRRRRCDARREARRRAAVPIASRRLSRDAWIASGSTSSIRSAIRRVARNQDRLGLERGIERVGLERRRDRADHRRRIRRLAARAGDQRAHHQLLDRFVAGERFGVGLRQPFELARTALRLDDDRRGKAAVDRQQRRLGSHCRSGCSVAARRARSAARERSPRRSPRRSAPSSAESASAP